MTQIAKAADLPTSTAHRLLTELTAWGALSRDDNGRYQIGLRLWEVSQHAGRVVRETARPHLQDLHRLSQETALFVAREGYGTLTLERVYGSDKLPKSSSVGSKLPLHTTAAGLVLLAYEEEWFQETYLRRDLEAFTSNTITAPERLKEVLQKIRADGYAHTVESMRASSSSIAVPVFTGDHQVTEALGLVFSTARTTSVNRYLPILREVARKIEQDVLLRRTPYKSLWPSLPTPRAVRDEPQP